MYIDKIMFTYLYSNTHLQLLGEERRRGDGVGEEPRRYLREMVFWCFFFLLTNDDFVQVYQQRGNNILSEKHRVGIDKIGRSRFNLFY